MDPHPSCGNFSDRPKPICVPLTAKCSLDSRRFLRACSSTRAKKASATSPFNSRSQFFVNTVGWSIGWPSWRFFGSCPALTGGEHLHCLRDISENHECLFPLQAGTVKEGGWAVCSSTCGNPARRRSLGKMLKGGAIQPACSRSLPKAPDRGAWRYIK